MKKFIAYVAEAFQPLRAHDFPTVIEHDTRQSFPRDVETINASLAAGAIANPVYKTLKDNIASRLEKVLFPPEDIMNRAVRADEGGTRNFTLYDFYGGSRYANLIAGQLAKAEKAKPVSDADRIFMGWYLPVLREVAPLAAAIVALKGMAVKRVLATPESKEAKRQAFIAPMTKNETGIAIRKVLKQFTDKLAGQYEVAVAEYFQKLVEEFAKLSGEEQAEQRKGRALSFLQFPIWQRETEGTLKARMAALMTLKPDYLKSLATMAKEEAKRMQETFIYKTSFKLVSILEAKDVALASTPVVGNMSAGYRSFEGDIRIVFVDGSQFTVRNKVVLKGNSYGTIFNQFPTTFHDVVMPDGTKMGAPSEERMNTVFAKKA